MDRQTVGVSNDILDRSLIIEIIRVTERSAVAAARLRGQLNDIAADKAAIVAMHSELDLVNINGTIVIGEGDNAAVANLFVGERIGTGNGPQCDVALDPLEGTTICAKDLQNAMSVIAIAKPGSLLNAPDVYMEKVAVGPGYDEGIISLEKSPAENLASLANAKGVRISDLNVCILDRQRQYHRRHWSRRSHCGRDAPLRARWRVPCQHDTRGF